MKCKILPEALRRQLVKAGQARAAQITKAERQKFGRRAWQTRLAKARKAVES